MKQDEIIKHLGELLGRNQPDQAEERKQGQGAAIVSCMDGRLDQFLRPFSFVIRTAGAVTEPVEGSLGIASESTGVTFLATHGDCLAYQAAIEYLAGSFAGKVADPNTVRNLNRNDTKALLRYINTLWPLNALPDPHDQNALAHLAIRYAVQWTSSGQADKPRIGLFIDLKAVLATEPRVWVVSYDGLSGPELAGFLRSHSMGAQMVSAHVLQALNP
jgi:hypothetical protein